MFITDRHSGKLGCSARLLQITTGQLEKSSSALSYKFALRRSQPCATLKSRSFCIDPVWLNSDSLRLPAWATISLYVDRNYVRLLYGYPSFAGLGTALRTDSFGLLYQRDLPPQRLRSIRGKLGLRPLLKIDFKMRGWVSNQAIFDHNSGTLHFLLVSR